MMWISGSLILAGQLLGTAFACGLNLYATVALVGAAARLDLLPLPPGMSGLESGFIIGSAAALFVVEFVIDRVPLVSAAWEGVHTFIRPAAAGLLAVLAFDGAPLWLQLGAALAAAAVALAAHGSKAGIRLILSTAPAGRRRNLVRTLVSLAEDIAAVAIAIAALLFPTFAVGVLAASLLILLLAGPRLWRAASFGLFAVRARLRGIFGRPGWRTRDQLPRDVRDVIPLEPLGRSPARAAAVAINGLPRVGAWRNGWLVFTCDGPRFVYRSTFRTRSAELPSAIDVRLRDGLLADVLDVRTGPGDRPFSLFLLKDGPPARVTAAELSSLPAGAAP
jgi:hypothetical protein